MASYIDHALVPNESKALCLLRSFHDVLYDHAVKFIRSCAVPANEMYEKGAMSHEILRTLSRLVEMQLAEYMAKPHVAAGVV
jgi:predicted ATPase